MNPPLILSSSDKKEKFRAILKEFMQVLGFIAVLGLLGLWWVNDYRKSQTTLQCDAEVVAKRFGEPHFIGTGAIFSGGALQSSEQAHSGSHSLRLHEAQAFGFQYYLEDLSGTETVSATVWRKQGSPGGQEGVLVASVPGLVYELTGEGLERDADSWEKLQLVLQLGCEVEHKRLTLYCWNPASQVVYFDDIEIEVQRAAR